ncbi:MAG TPA: DUF6069 family protein [Micromonosporaceae bacterium]|nr:DUF6069 family protein [Micromonosporaceae bacterium]
MSTDTHSRPRSPTRRDRASTVLAAAVAGLLGWLVADPIAGIDLTVRQGAGDEVQHVGPTAVAVAGLVAGLLGWAVLAGLERVTARARAVWTAVAAGTLVVSLLGPLAAVNASTRAALTGLHLLVGAVLIVGLRRTARRS